MKRPKCATCPYYEETELFEQGTSEGLCIRHPPSLVAKSDRPEQYEAWANPVVSSEDSCGEHPDFPAYIEVRQARRAQPLSTRTGPPR